MNLTTTTMTEALVTYELKDSIALIGLNRTAKRNALSTQVIEQIRVAVLRAGDEAKAGVIFGHGDHFSAGLDLAERAQRKAAGIRRPPHIRAWHTAFDHIARGAIPFVAALQGAVVGGGLELAAAAHVRVADETTFFGLPEAQRGIFVGGGGSVRIGRLLGVARMCDMMLTGRLLTAHQGEMFNLTQYVVPAGEALPRAIEVAQRIAENAPLSNFAITNSLPRIQDLSHDDGLFFETLVAAFTSSEESDKRVADFVNKRVAPLSPARPARKKRA